MVTGSPETTCRTYYLLNFPLEDPELEFIQKKTKNKKQKTNKQNKKTLTLFLSRASFPPTSFKNKDENPGTKDAGFW